MRIINISDYDEHTMTLAGPVYDAHRRILLAASITIKPNILNRLKEFGISHLVIEDGMSKGIALDELLDMTTWIDIICTMKEIVNKISAQLPFPLREMQDTVNKIIYEVKQRSFTILIPSTSVATDLHVYAHAVNVALLSLQIGKKLGYNDTQLRDLAVGSLLHDIGKVASSDEKMHPETGFNLLRRINEISLMSAHVAYQHHETVDGKGYPRGLEGKTIIEYAQVCGVANAYENLISRKAVSPQEAMQAILELNGTAYAGNVMDALVHSVPTYPAGTKVRMHNGEPAIIVHTRENILRPVIRMLSTEEEISLVDHPDLIIAGIES